MNVGIERKVVVLSSIDSTNVYALEHAQVENWPEGSIVMADFQTAGRGQRGNSWYSSPEKNLLLSMVYYPDFLPFEKQHFLHYCTSIALQKTLDSLSIPATIKWPNDLLVDDKKIAGILIQNIIRGQSFGLSVIGIGLNVNETDFPSHLPHATSVKRLTGKSITPGRLLSVLLSFFDPAYDLLRKGDYDNLLRQYLEHFYGMEEKRSFSIPGGKSFEGVIRGVDAQGRLVVNINGEVKAFGLKEIEWKW